MTTSLIEEEQGVKRKKAGSGVDNLRAAWQHQRVIGICKKR